jgi:hypothetical protein
MSIAFTKDVHTIGRIKVRYSKWAYTANRKAAVDTKNMIQAIEVFLRSISISIVCTKIVKFHS